MSDIAKVNLFIKPVLSDIDQMNGYIFNALQIMVLQQELTVAAEMLVALRIKNQNVMEFVQEQAYWNSRVEFIQHLLERSEKTIEVLQTDVQNPQT